MKEFVEYSRKARIKTVKSLLKDCKGTVIELGANFDNCILNESIKVDIKKNCDIQADFNYGIPLPSNSADIILACEVIEHLIYPFLFLKEIKRVLKPKGILILTTPNICSIKNRILVLFGRFPNNAAQADFYRYWINDKNLPQLAHYSDYTYSTIIRGLKKEGFKILEKKTSGIFIKGKLIFPLKLTPPTFGENIIIKAKLIQG